MAKVAKVKKREPTVHSRAHRRNATPPPKDLAVKAPAVEEESEYKPWLHNAQNAGISKKRKTKQLSRNQKVRQQRAMEKADANLDKLATKVKQSKARAGKVQARAAAWEELNGVVGGDSNGKEDVAAKGEEWEDVQEGVELDVGMEEAAAGVEKQEEKGAAAAAAATDADAEAMTVALPQLEEDEEL